MRILNTRPIEQIHELTSAIRAADGISVELPTVSIQPTTNWLNTLPNLTTVHQAVFVSKPAIHYFFLGLDQNHLLWPKDLPITVLGQGSAQALMAFGLSADYIPITSDSEHLLQMPHLQILHNQSILMIKGQGGRTLLTDTLTKRGAMVHAVDVYTRQLPEKNPIAITSVWQNDEVDIILFTSQQAMEHLFVLLGPAAHAWIRQKPCVVISPRLAQAAKNLGIQSIITTRYEDLLKTLEGFNHDSK